MSQNRVKYRGNKNHPPSLRNKTLIPSLDMGEGLIHRDILIVLWEVTKRKEGAKVFHKPTPCPNTQRVTSRVFGGKLEDDSRII